MNMDLDNLKRDILKCVVKYGGQWSLYQLDRALSYDENLPVIHRLGEALRDLKQEGLIRAEREGGLSRYWITEAGKHRLTQQEEVAA